MTTDKDQYIARLRANVPEALKERPVWLCWRSVPHKNPAEKPRKVPFYTDGTARGDGGKLDSPEDRARLAGFADAVATYHQGRFTGLGVALGEGLCGVDLDDIAPSDPRAAETIAAASSYTETSPSGTGLKIFGTGDIGTVNKTECHLEIYSGTRFFTVTGLALNGAALADLTAGARTARRLFLPMPETNKPQQSTTGKKVTSKRHNYLTTIAGRFQNKRLEPGELKAALLAHNAEHCDPPLPEVEVLEIAAWAATKPQPQEPQLPRILTFTLDDLAAPPREEKYLLPGMVPTEAYTLIAGALASYKSMLLLNMIVWRATGYDLLGLAGKLERVPQVGEPGPCVLASYEDTDWRIFARFQRILNDGAQLIKRAHGAVSAAEFLARAVKNIRRVPLTGQLGMTLVYRMERDIVPNHAFLDAFRAVVREFTSEGVLIGLDPLRLAIVGSQNDDDGADMVVTILNQLAVMNPDSGLVAVSHGTKQGAKDSTNGYADAAYATSGSALYSQHARSNFLLARLKPEEIQSQFDLPSAIAARQTVARLKHGRLSHDVETAELYLQMDGGLLRPIAPRSAPVSAGAMIDRALPVVAEAIARLTEQGIPASGNALVQDRDLAQLAGTKPQTRELIKLLETSGFIVATGATIGRRYGLTESGQQRLVARETSWNESEGGRP